VKFEAAAWSLMLVKVFEGLRWLAIRADFEQQTGQPSKDQWIDFDGRYPSSPAINAAIRNRVCAPPLAARAGDA
jgi:hypothetical protein